jgi:Flp pilus assembly protein TadD
VKQLCAWTLVLLFPLFSAGAAVAQSADDSPLISAAITSGRLVQAEAMLDRAAPAQHGLEIDILTARLLLAQERNADAFRVFDRLVDISPDRCVVLIGLGIAATRIGRPDRAIVALSRATVGCRAEWPVWSALGVSLGALRRWPESDAAFANALDLAGPDPVLLNNIGVSLLHQRRFAEAVGYLRGAARQRPDDRRIVDNLDMAAASIGDAPDRDAVRDDTARWSDRLVNAGRAALAAGRTGEARAYFAQAVTIGPVLSAEADRALAALR